MDSPLWPPGPVLLLVELWITVIYFLSKVWGNQEGTPGVGDSTFWNNKLLWNTNTFPSLSIEICQHLRKQRCIKSWNICNHPPFKQHLWWGYKEVELTTSVFILILTNQKAKKKIKDREVSQGKRRYRILQKKKKTMLFTYFSTQSYPSHVAWNLQLAYSTCQGNIGSGCSPD